MRAALLALALVIASAAPIAAQTVQNPTRIVFTPSADHDAISEYEADIVTADGKVLQTINLGKPPVDAANECTATINVQPVAFGRYTVVMRAVAAGIRGPNSAPSNTWERAPGAPSKARAQ